MEEESQIISYVNKSLNVWWKLYVNGTIKPSSIGASGIIYQLISMLYNYPQKEQILHFIIHKQKYLVFAVCRPFTSVPEIVQMIYTYYFDKNMNSISSVNEMISHKGFDKEFSLQIYSIIMGQLEETIDLYTVMETLNKNETFMTGLAFTISKTIKWTKRLKTMQNKFSLSAMQSTQLVNVYQNASWFYYYEDMEYGPFSSEQMIQWYDAERFPDSLLIKCNVNGIYMPLKHWLEFGLSRFMSYFPSVDGVSNIYHMEAIESLKCNDAPNDSYQTYQLGPWWTTYKNYCKVHPILRDYYIDTTGGCVQFEGNELDL